MASPLRHIALLISVFCGTILLSSFLTGSEVPFGDKKSFDSYHFPYRQAGLTEKQAAAHLIGRFTYGATPGQVDEVARMGLEKWFSKQLEASLPDDSLDVMLSGYDALKLSNAEVAQTYPRAGEVFRMAKRDGMIPADSTQADRKEYKDILKAYMDQKGYKPVQELYRQFFCQKVLRAAYSDNQLQEVMTDFWFNHFNVSVTKNDCATFIPAYERDAIRPNALSTFSGLLLATAKSPAMLYYLDNFSSSAASAPQRRAGRFAGMDTALKPRKTGGINENYAREVMELHTLGVDGGYTQSDVTQAARVLTGWTVYPMGDNPLAKRLADMGDDQMAQKGFVHQGDFLFAANRHDKDVKTVLGKTFGPDQGYQEGVDLLEMLAHHPSTAHFICHKLAVRFVSDDPPSSLVDKMAKTFLQKNGDIRQVLITMVSSPEFWSPASVREKIKSPFELAISAIRSLNATIDHPYPLYTWVAKMGEKLYYYQAPTGFPDKAQYWINTGALLYRMNFGLALASGRIPGVHTDLVALNDNHEPESAQAALITYCHILMPQRSTDETVKRLEPMLSDPSLAVKVQSASARVAPAGDPTTGMAPDGPPALDMAVNNAAQTGNNQMLSQVVGIIIGSPEFQRR